MDAFFTKSESVTKQYKKPMQNTRYSDIALCVMFGPDADKIAEEFGIPKGFRRKEGWVVSKSKRKQIRKKYRLKEIDVEKLKPKAEPKNEKSVVL